MVEALEVAEADLLLSSLIGDSALEALPVHGDLLARIGRRRGGGDGQLPVMAVPKEAIATLPTPSSGDCVRALNEPWYRDLYVESTVGGDLDGRRSGWQESVVDGCSQLTVWRKASPG